MKINRISIVKKACGLGLLLGLMVACAPITPANPALDKAGATNPPLLLDSFAVSSLRPGQTWPIFLEGDDPDGDMKDIWFVASQIGGNVWVNQFVELKGQDRRHFMGYVALPTPITRYGSSTGWETVRIEVRIRDSAGLYSEQRIHEVLIGSHTAEPIPAKWAPVARYQLGTVFLDFELDREHHKPMFRR